MKFTNPIRSLVALSMLVLFTLQAGLGLYLHNAFHQPAPVSKLQSVCKAGVAVTPATEFISCSCVDDFLVPFSKANHLVLLQAPLLFFVQHQAGYYNYLPDSLRIFRSLRAPPAFVS